MCDFSLIQSAHRVTHVPQVILVDECFPKNTFIDGVKIQDIKKGDLVRSYNHQTNVVELKEVLKTYKSKPKNMVVVKIGSKTVITTENHPFYTHERGYINAKKLSKYDSVLQILQKGHGVSKTKYQSTSFIPFKRIFLLQQRLLFGLSFTRIRQEIPKCNLSSLSKRNAVLQDDTKPKEKLQRKRWKSVLFQRLRSTFYEKDVFREYVESCKPIFQRANESTQSHAQPRNKGKDVDDFKRNRTQAQGTRRERTWLNESPRNTLYGFKRKIYRCLHRIYNKDKCKKKQQSLKPIFSLQDRYIFRESRYLYRSRWRKPSFFKNKGKGQEKRELFKGTRVQSVAIYEPRNNIISRLLLRNYWTYNIEVADNNNYFVEDVLVHNCHNAASNTYAKLFAKFFNAKIIGFSATPVRLGRKQLGDVFEDIVQGKTVKWMLENGYLAPYRVKCNINLDFDNVGIRSGDYKTEELSLIMEHEQVYRDTVSLYTKHIDGKKTIVYCVSIKAAEETALFFRAKGYRAEAISSKTPKAEREKIIRDFRSGFIKILTNSALILEGLDIPDCEAVMDLAKTKSLARYTQKTMRCMRIDPKNPDKVAMIIDCVGNVLEHGYVCDDREWTLNYSAKDKPSEAIVKLCPDCQEVCYAVARRCKNCGHEFPFTEKEKGIADVSEVDDAEKVMAMYKAMNYDEYTKFTTWDELELFRKSRKKKDGKPYHLAWSLYKAKELGIEIPQKYRHQLHYLKR